MLKRERKRWTMAARHASTPREGSALLDEIPHSHPRNEQDVLPSSGPGHGLQYTLAIWKKLIRFLDYPELELSNNFAEELDRPIAVGRNNWIHPGASRLDASVAILS